MTESGLGRFLGSEPTAYSLAVIDGGGPAPIRRALERLFENQSVQVTEAPSGVEDDEDRVVLLDDGEVVASDPLSTVYESILGVNTDLYTTGARELEEAALPDIIEAMADTTFHLRGYPASDREKLLLVAISRAIERRAFRGGAGKVRSSFQYLSRIEDERGTRTVYERLAERGLDVHLYGRPDWAPDPSFGVTIHGGYTAPFTDSWFVVHDPAEGEAAALVALQRERSRWDGVWTFDPERVHEIARYIEREL